MYVFICFLITCTFVFVLGCNWPYLAVFKHVNKLIELNYYNISALRSAGVGAAHSVDQIRQDVLL
jgi:hypothetical protein